MHHVDSPSRRACTDVAPALTCSSTYGGLDAAWVHLAGALYIATAPVLERTLRESQEHARLVVLDLRELTFMDCSGVHPILDASRRARCIGHRLVLVRGRPDVYRVLALTGSAADIEIADLEPVQPPLASVQGSVDPHGLLA
jgi:anti-anti-sigma factor